MNDLEENKIFEISKPQTCLKESILLYIVSEEIMCVFVVKFYKNEIISNGYHDKNMTV